MVVCKVNSVFILHQHFRTWNLSPEDWTHLRMFLSLIFKGYEKLSKYFMTQKKCCRRKLSRKCYCTVFCVSHFSTFVCHSQIAFWIFRYNFPSPLQASTNKSQKFHFWEQQLEKIDCSVVQQFSSSHFEKDLFLWQFTIASEWALEWDRKWGNRECERGERRVKGSTSDGRRRIYGRCHMGLYKCTFSNKWCGQFI